MGYLRYQLAGVRWSFAEDYICGDKGHESGYGLASDRRKVFYRLVPLDIRWRVCGEWDALSWPFEN
jgi:hypothetical protein